MIRVLRVYQKYCRLKTDFDHMAAGTQAKVNSSARKIILNDVEHFFVVIADSNDACKIAGLEFHEVHWNENSTFTGQVIEETQFRVRLPPQLSSDSA